jgi:hypothetical protein
MALGSERTPGPNDFDFLMGSWKVHHRKLRSRLSGCTEWIDSDGTSFVRPLMGGLANVDDNVIEGPTGAYRACSFRVFNPSADRWSIWWFDSRIPGQPVDPPVVGRFENGIGTFYSEEVIGGTPVRVRYLWTATRSPNPRWEQAFSVDQGVTWETNWIMEFVRSPSESDRA